MSLVVLVILAMVWAVFLLPQLFRARAERSTDSIGTFRHQLSILERTTPVGGPNVTRFGSPRSPRLLVDNQPVRRSSTPARPRAPRAATLRAATPRAGTTRAATPRTGTTLRHHPGRAEARKRRRDVFCGLLVAMGASLVLGLVPSLRIVLGLHLVLDLAFVVYVALLVRARNLAAERDLKVRFLPTTSTVQPTLLLRHSAN